MNTQLTTLVPRPSALTRLMLSALACAGLLAPAQRAHGAVRRTSADIAITKTADETATPGGQITYNIVVFNSGPDDATSVTVTDQLPAHTSYVSASSSQGTVSFSNNTVTAALGPLAVNETATVTIIVSVNNDTPKGTVISNTADVSSSPGDPEASNNSSTAQTAVVGVFSGDILISEFRLRGPGSAPGASQQANDEFIELFNNTETPVLVSTNDGSAGWAVAASDGVVRCTVPNGTVISARGHFLCVNSAGYSLSNYPAGEGTTATGDAAYTADIPDNAGVALFRTADPAMFTLTNRLDAAGSTAEANTLYKEGNGYPALSGAAYAAGLDYSFVRDLCGKGGSTTTGGACPTGGAPKNTNDNAADFIFVDTQGTNAGAGQRLGAPGPENLSSPVQRNSQMPGFLLDSTKGSASPPNRVRDFTPDLVNNSPQGTLDIRRRVVNGTGLPVTRLRFRIIDITTFPTPSNYADLRARTSAAVVVSGVADPATCGDLGTPCAVTVQGTELEQPPAQRYGGGFNSSLSAGTVTLATPLAPGGSINVRFLLGVQRGGVFKLLLNVETLTDESGGELQPGLGGVPAASAVRR